MANVGQSEACAALSSDFLDQIMRWASGVADAFRKYEHSLQTGIHKLELSLATLTATTEAKRQLLVSQMDNDERAAQALKEKIELENTKYVEVAAIKQGEITRYESMLNDLGLMHQRSIVSLERRIEEFRERLKTERETVLEEQRRLGANNSALRAENRSADDSRDEEMQQLAASVQRQEAHIAALAQECKDLDKKHRDELHQKSKDQLREITSATRNNESELDLLLTQLKADSRRDQDYKDAEVRRMQDMIKQKESRLVQLGVDPGDTLVALSSLNGAGSVLSDGKAYNSVPSGRKVKQSKKKQSCQQS